MENKLENHKKPSFLVYLDNEVVIQKLPDEDAGKLFKALFLYSREKTKPDFDDNLALSITFDILSTAIDRDAERYYNRCQKNRENGRKGGRPRNNQPLIDETEKSERFFAKPKKADKDMDKDKDMDMDRDRDIINYQQIADLYNATCVSFPALKILSDSRKKSIKARLKTYTVDDFKKVFELAEGSDFLKGKNDRNWKANFDWLIAEKNMIKVLEGTYENKPDKKEKEDSIYDDWGSAEDFYSQFIEK